MYIVYKNIVCIKKFSLSCVLTLSQILLIFKAVTMYFMYVYIKTLRGGIKLHNWINIHSKHRHWPREEDIMSGFSSRPPFVLYHCEEKNKTCPATRLSFLHLSMKTLHTVHPKFGVIGKIGAANLPAPPRALGSGPRPFVR